MKKTTIVLAIFLCSVGITFSQNKKTTLIKQIDAYTKKIDSVSKFHKDPTLIFANISQTSKPKWRKFTSTNTLEEFRKKTETYSISYNWTKNHRIIISTFTFFSESGDWANYVHYYYRQDGTLAKIESEYRTFYGHFVAIQNIYFNNKGKILKKNIKYLNLENTKRKTVNKDDLADNTTLFDFDFYKKTSNLPFAHLLKKK